MTDSKAELKKCYYFFNGLYEVLEDYEINGKTFKEWKTYFNVAIDPSLDIGGIKNTLLELSYKWNEASFHHKRAAASLRHINGLKEHHRLSKFEEITDKYKSIQEKLKRANKEMLKTIEEGSVADLSMALTWAEIEERFWSEIKDDLKMQIEITKNLIILLTAEMKQIGS